MKKNPRGKPEDDKKNTPKNNSTFGNMSFPHKCTECHSRTVNLSFPHLMRESLFLQCC